MPYSLINNLVHLLKLVLAVFMGSFALTWTQLMSTLIQDKVADIAGVEPELLGDQAATLINRAFLVIAERAANICGASNFHPAVTVATAVYGRLSPRAVVPYLAAQTAGAISALLLATRLLHPAAAASTRQRLGRIFAAPAAAGAAMAASREFLLTFILVFNMADAICTEDDQVNNRAAAAATMVDFLSGLPVGVSTNPASTLGLAISTGIYQHAWVKILAQMLGAIAGMGINIFLQNSSDG